VRIRAAVGTAVWFGLTTGLAEVLVLAFRKLVLGQMIDTGPDFVWMAPAANLVIALPLAIVIAVALVPLGRLGWRPNAWRLLVVCLGTAGFMNLLLLVPRLHHYAALTLSLGLAIQTARVLTQHTAGFLALCRRTVPWMVAITLALAAAVHGSQALAESRALAALPRAPTGAPNVLLIVIDTARAWNFSLYGYARPTTPRLDRLAATSAVFERALSTAPWTLPSHGSMFTGRWAHELTADWRQPLDTRDPTLGEALAAHGYLTAGFVANTGYCSREHGLARGFAHYEDYAISLGQVAHSSALLRTIANNFRLRALVKNDEHLNRIPADEVNRRFLRWLATASPERPFFAFLNYYDAHGPYLPPSPFAGQFRSAPPSGKLSPIHRWNFQPGAPAPTAAEVEMEIAEYDGALAYVDDRIGALLDDLSRRQLLAKTIVIVTSDHGEEFGEHRLFEHGNSLYWPSLHVPLLISYPPRIPAGRVAVPVSLRDLPATVLDVTGLQPARPFPGESLARRWDGRGVGGAGQELLISSVRRATGLRPWFPVSKGDMITLAGKGRRYIRNGDATEEMYDFENDYWETRNLAGLEAGQDDMARFRGALEGLAPAPRTRAAGPAR
jgi:arylsulfatase A-like enzyme